MDRWKHPIAHFRAITTGTLERRMVLVFLPAVIVLQALFQKFVLSSPWFREYLEWTTSVAAMGMRAVGVDVASDGFVLFSSTASVTVGVGCDGLQPIILLALFLLCIPRHWRWRAAALGVGVPLLLFMNWIRLGTLFWIREYCPSFFDTVHYALWPATFLLVTVLFVGVVLSVSRPAAGAGGDSQ